MKGLFDKAADQDGFSLVEILIGMLIFAIGILAVIGMQLHSIRTNAYAYRLTEASNLARQTMEDLLSREFDDADLEDDDSNGLEGLEIVGEEADGEKLLDHYSVYWNVARNQPLPSTKTLQVIVTWPQGGETKRVFYRSIVTDDE